jgi:septum formation protein
LGIDLVTMQGQRLHPESLETPLFNENPGDYVKRVARDKALFSLRGLQSADASRESAFDILLAADTTVSIDDCILGKPANSDEALAMLWRLSGRTHCVQTSVVVASDNGQRLLQDTATCKVTFAKLEPPWMRWMSERTECLDKAGGYGIQGNAGFVIESIQGDASAIMGLPLGMSRQLLLAATQ